MRAAVFESGTSLYAVMVVLGMQPSGWTTVGMLDLAQIVVVMPIIAISCGDSILAAAMRLP